jgi:ABC-2 type transport system ATP-binding protein
MDLLDVREIVNIQVRKLSLGQRMKCELIAALLHNPKVLFLDEPTIGLDVVMQKVLRDFIKAYNQEFGATIILTSHYMGDVKELCKRAIVIDHGHKIFDGDLDEIIERFARNKILTFTLSEEVDLKVLNKYGTLKEYTHPQATILVPRAKAAKIAGELLTHLPIIDVNIEEPTIDAIIRELFNSQKVATKTK